jgi:hypothetical protein
MKGSLIFVAVTGAPIVAGHDNGNVDSPIATISGRHVSARSAAFTLAHPASQIGSRPLALAWPRSFSAAGQTIARTRGERSSFASQAFPPVAHYPPDFTTGPDD